MKTCECNESLGNTGEAGCQPIFKVTKKIILVPTYDSTGARNKITVATPLTQVAFDDLINQADATKRWYPLPLLENVTGERAESSFETAPSGRKAFIKQGTRSFAAEIWEQSAPYKQQLDAVRCNDVSVFFIDAEGNIRGIIDGTDETILYPVKIDNNSFDAKLIMGTDTIAEKLMISFDYDQTEDDGSLRLISASDIAAELLDGQGLLDISSTITNISTTGFKAKLTTKYGSLANKVVDSGLIITDFALYNVTDSLAVTIATMTESPKGTYAFTFLAQTSADVLRLTPTKDGRDYSTVVTNTILIP